MKGTVFSVALNHQSQLDAWGDSFQKPPYQTPPKEAVWFIKPRNTQIGHGETIPHPNSQEPVMSGATLALVVGKTARKVTPSEAQEYIAGFVLANEISLPENSFYRPAIKAKCRDGFCPMGSELKMMDEKNISVVTKINDQVVQTWNTADLVRSASQLLSALSDFVTLQPGDKILLGTPHERVVLQPGDRVSVNVDGFSPLENSLSQKGVLA